jgi:D-3-phosphoglycerate dehydrogenase
VLREASDLVLADLDRPGLLRAAREADILWVRLRHQIDAELLAAVPRLRLIATPTTGLNHIDLVEAERLGIRVLSLRGETEFLRDVRATAEHTLCLTFALLRHTMAAAAHVRQGGWDRDGFWGHELYGKTAGIIGYGRLGRIVARYLGAFGMRVLATDPYVDGGTVETDVQLVPLEILLREADLVSLHVNLNAETHGFFTRSQFAAMKRGAWFVNTARGELVDESALLEALRSGHVSGAALDVLSGECSAGMGSHPLVQYAREHDNLLITPHLGGCTHESMAKTELFLARKICNLAKHQLGPSPASSEQIDPIAAPPEEACHA